MIIKTNKYSTIIGQGWEKYRDLWLSGKQINYLPKPKA